MRDHPPHLPRNAPHALARIAAVVITLSLYSACAPDKSGPTEFNPRADAALNGVPFTEGLASPAWQQKARDLVSTANLAAVQATHVYPILGVAQYLAVQQAQAAISGGGRERLEADRGAVAGASFVTMS